MEESDVKHYKVRVQRPYGPVIVNGEIFKARSAKMAGKKAARSVNADALWHGMFDVTVYSLDGIILGYWPHMDRTS